jgi:hypothetical protein
MSQNRKGRTVITSVSLSHEFKHILDKLNLSPTEVMRKGIAICLYETGEERYQSETNKKRYEALTSFLQSKELIETLEDLERSIKEIKDKLQI